MVGGGQWRTQDIWVAGVNNHTHKEYNLQRTYFEFHYGNKSADICQHTFENVLFQQGLPFLLRPNN